MNEFSLRKDIPSVKVSKELIEQLEKYILKDVSEIIGIDSQLLKDNYTIEISDKLGSETFKSISDYSLNRFQDGTENIKFGFSLYNPLNFRLKLSFDAYKSSSKIDLSIKSIKPREKVNGIYNGILDRLKIHKTYNRHFHNSYVLGGFSVLNGIIFTISLIQFSKGNLIVSLILLLLAIGSIITIINIGNLKPYSEFDTNNQTINNKVFSWLAWGILSFIFFGLILGYLKDFTFN